MSITSNRIVCDSLYLSGWIVFIFVVDAKSSFFFSHRQSYLQGCAIKIHTWRWASQHKIVQNDIQQLACDAADRDSLEHFIVSIGFQLDDLGASVRRVFLFPKQFDGHGSMQHTQ